MLDSRVTRERLREWTCLLNGLKVIDTKISNGWGVEHADDPDQYSHILQSDVDGLVEQLEALLGATAAEVNRKALERKKPFRLWTGTVDFDMGN